MDKNNKLNKKKKMKKPMAQSFLYIWNLTSKDQKLVS